MPITTVTSRRFNQDASAAWRAAGKRPVIITDRGGPAHVLLTIEASRKLTRQSTSIVELLAAPDAGDVDFEAPRAGPLFRTAEPG